MDTTTLKSAMLTQRYDQLQQWLERNVQTAVQQILPLAGDASFRRYYRVFLADQSYIVMDAPPEKENCVPFVAIAQAFKNHAVCVPDIVQHDIASGFLLLSDLGDRLYLQEFAETNVNELYQRAFHTLLQIQSCSLIDNYVLPDYSEKLLQNEMSLFIDWYLTKYRQIEISEEAKASFTKIFTQLAENAVQQPQVCVHRDYHSRNLLVWENSKVGVLDFQDAVRGAITYDLVSLLRDCYVEWPEAQVYAWVSDFYRLLGREDFSLDQFVRWFDWMGLQRHLKCLGIFARLFLRDHKSGYLQDIPRVVRYARRVCEKYAEFTFLLSYL